MTEATVVQKLNQGVCTDVLYPHPCLNFLLLFLSREKVKGNGSGENDNTTEIKLATDSFNNGNYS